MTENKTPQTGQSLQAIVSETIDNYFLNLHGEKIVGLHDLLLTEAEEPMLKVLLNHTQQNQSQAASLLGLSRGTLRKKLKRYHLL